MAVTLGSSLVCWLPREGIRDNLPEMLKKNGHYMLRCIIDCAEVFVERPKSLLIQAQTWSDYKHHNTFKFLIGISPTGFITFNFIGLTSFLFGSHSQDLAVHDGFVSPLVTAASTRKNNAAT